MADIIHLNRDLESLVRDWLAKADGLQGVVCIGINKNGSIIHRYGWNNDHHFTMIGLMEAVKKIMIEEGEE
jgi:hypothetical protein